MFDESRPLANKIWDAVQISILVAIFLNFFVVNFILSENWEFLLLRNLDDYAMQYSVHRIQTAMLEHDWHRVFTFFEYAYGNAYWLLTATLLMPFHLLDSVQAIIVAGREISLLFFFGSVYLMGLIIDKVYPDARYLKYPTLILMATMPLVSIFTTKLHVNMQSLFWGFFALYVLVKDPVLKRRQLCWSAVLGGMCAGFKLTGILMAPLLGLILLDKLSNRTLREKVKEIALYLLFYMVAMAATTAPVSLLFPFFKVEMGEVFNNFHTFRKMGSSELGPIREALVPTLRYYLSPLNQGIFAVLFTLLIVSRARLRQYLSLFILISIAISIGVAVVAVNKAPIYIASYVLNLYFLIPIGLLGLSVIPISKRFKIVLAYGVVIAGLLDIPFHSDAYIVNADIRAMMKDPLTQNELKAGEEIRRLITPFQHPVSVLQDIGTLFPGTPFTGVTTVINYGDLYGFSLRGVFDFILLNSAHYYGQLPPPAPGKPLDTEAQIRETLHKEGAFFGARYKLIYEQHGIQLYQLVSRAEPKK